MARQNTLQNFSLLLQWKTEATNEEPVPLPDISSEDPPAFPSTSAENKQNIPNQDSKGDESPQPHPTDICVDMDREVPPCDSDTAMWFPASEKHVSFWSTATI